MIGPLSLGDDLASEMTEFIMFNTFILSSEETIIRHSISNHDLDDEEKEY